MIISKVAILMEIVLMFAIESLGVDMTFICCLADEPVVLMKGMEHPDPHWGQQGEGQQDCKKSYSKLRIHRSQI